MLEVLRSALDAADWPRALAAALEAWRALRASELADLVEALGARCVVVPPPEHSQQRHAWWIEHAARYEPAAVTYLVSQAQHGARASEVNRPSIRARWGDAHPLIATLLAGSPKWFDAVSQGSHRNAVDRLAAVLAWPPDPRTAPLLAAALEIASLEIWGTMLDPVCALVADALIALGDTRILPRLAELTARPPGDDVNLMMRTRHAARAWHALEARRRLPDPDLAALGAWLAPDPATPPPTRAGARAAASLPMLWAQVAAHPDEIGPRLVLGDALVELGETRGELIVLQCAGEQRDSPPEDLARAKLRVEQLVEQQWERWLGPLAPFLHRSGCELRRGMLEVVSVGVPDAPATGWREAAGHHELFAIQTLRPHRISPLSYALFVEGLTRLPRRLCFEGPTAIELLGAHAGALSVETVSYSHHGRTQSPPPESISFPAAITALARLVPELDVLALEAGCPPDEADALLPQLPRMFRRLRRVEVAAALLHGPGYRDRLARYRSLPFVQILWARGSGPPAP